MHIPFHNEGLIDCVYLIWILLYRDADLSFKYDIWKAQCTDVFFAMENIIDDINAVFLWDSGLYYCQHYEDWGS